MLGQSMIIAHKELIDSLRDTRSLLSSLLYTLMGPGVIFMVSFTQAGSDHSVLVGMMSVFLMLSAFVGGMNVSMDLLAGERERRSLLPLLLNPVTTWDVVLGKWLTIAFFSTVAVVISVAAFTLVLSSAHVPISGWTRTALILASGLVPLALFAAAVELGVSTICRTVKEAHTWLSMVVFVPMGFGMFSVFFPNSVGGWARILPVIGQQYQLEHWARRDVVPIGHALALCAATAAFVAAALRITSNLLERDSVVYGS